MRETRNNQNENGEKKMNRMIILWPIFGLYLINLLLIKENRIKKLEKM